MIERVVWIVVVVLAVALALFMSFNAYGNWVSNPVLTTGALKTYLKLTIYESVFHYAFHIFQFGRPDIPFKKSSFHPLPYAPKAPSTKL